MTEPLLSTEQAAERLGVSRNAVGEWVRTGKLRAARIGNKVWRIDPKDLVAFVNAGYEYQAERKRYTETLAELTAGTTDGLIAGIPEKKARQRRSKAA